MAELTLTTLLSLAGTAITGFSTFAAAQANAAQMEFNASIAEENARRAIERSQIEQEEQDRLTRGMIGEQMAAQAASGVNVGTGSPLRTRLVARELGRLDALNVRQAGEIESYNYKAQAAGLRAQAKAEKMGGAFGLVGSFLNAGTTITTAKPVARKNYYAPVPTPRPAYQIPW